MATDIKDLYNSSIYAKLRITSAPMSFRSLIDNGIATEGDLIFDVDALPYGAFHTLGHTFYFFNRDLYNDYITELHDPRYVKYLPAVDASSNSVTNTSLYTYDVSIQGRVYLNNITSSLKLTIDVLNIDGKNFQNALTLDANATSNYKPYIDVSAYTNFSGLSLLYGGWPLDVPASHQDLAGILSNQQGLILAKVELTEYNTHVNYIKNRIDIVDSSIIDLNDKLDANSLADASLALKLNDSSAYWDQCITDISTDLYALEEDIIEYIETNDNRLDKIENIHTNDLRYTLSLITDVSSRIANNSDRIIALNDNLIDFQNKQTLYNQSNDTFRTTTLQYLSLHGIDISTLMDTDNLHDLLIADISTRLYNTSAVVDQHTINIEKLDSHIVDSDSSITHIYGLIRNIEDNYVTITQYNDNNVRINNKISADISSAIRTYDTSVNAALKKLNLEVSNNAELKTSLKVINKALFDLDSRAYNNKTKLYELENYTIPLLDASLYGYAKKNIDNLDASVKNIFNKVDTLTNLSIIDSSEFNAYAQEILEKLRKAEVDIRFNSADISTLKTDVNENTENINKLTTQVYNTDTVLGFAFNNINKRIVDLSTNLKYFVTYDYLLDNFPEADKDIASLKNDFNALEKVVTQQYSTLDGKITDVNNYLIDKAAPWIHSIEVKVDALEKTVNQQYTALDGKITDVSIRLTDKTGPWIHSIEAKVEELQEIVDYLTAQIETLKA